ncbi:hypothetical protein POM88_001122 [Heracleum sosnowskyi]|uniref:Dicer dsRNA-binding fold domain-containing protein n=1 Tax=Heracleum sosnowskyi TaxID=360622 RepID=A0AAD8JFI1_9APIA|nr:hypothetical protein POM88_001122 [Heracleum sosnowskyi]
MEVAFSAKKDSLQGLKRNIKLSFGLLQRQVMYHGDLDELQIDHVYLMLRPGDIEHLSDRAILTPLGEYVDSVNKEPEWMESNIQQEAILAFCYREGWSKAKSLKNFARERVDNYLASGQVMRQESLRHAAVPCQPLDTEIYNEEFYRVDSTGAIVTLSSSVSLIYFYCSHLPSDGVTVQGSVKTLKQLACLEACKKLHIMGALTDNLVPDMVEEEDEEMGRLDYVDEQDIYVPSELVGLGLIEAGKTYYCYLLELDSRFSYDIKVDHLMLAASSELNFDEDNNN